MPRKLCATAAAVPATRYYVFFSIALVGLAVDLATKHWMFQWLQPYGQIHWIWTGYVGLQTSLNEGALFGVGQGMVGFYAVLSVIAAIAIPIWLFAAGAAADWVLNIALACIMAGILGNLHDRLGLHGLVWGSANRLGDPVYAVRDFVLLQASNRLRWPNFNVADSLLVCGAGLLMWQTFRKPAGNRN